MASIIGGAVLLIALVTVLLVATHQGPAASKSTSLRPAIGQTVDGMECVSAEGSIIHVHAYLEIYVNGQAMTVPPGLGIVGPPGTGVSALGSDGLKSCLYPLHVHDGEPNIVHIESPVQRTYTLGNVFDLWGQPLSATQVMGNKTDGAHKLVFDVFDASGKLTQVTTDPRAIDLASRETVIILYNSPNVPAKAFTGWDKLGLSQ